MQLTFSTIILALSAAVVPSLAQSVSVSWDTIYDNSGDSLNNVACSDGANGLITKGYTTFGSLPTFPRIGGAPAVGAWNSAACGTCWQLTYNGNSINVLAIDTGGEGFNLSEEAMDQLTSGQARQLGRVTAGVAQVDNSVCGVY